MAGRLAVFSAVLLSWITLSPPVSGYSPCHAVLRALPSGRAWHCPAGGAVHSFSHAPPILRGAPVFPLRNQGRVGAARSGALGTQAAAERVERGDVVKLHFTGRLDDGTIWDETRGDEPIEFKVGSGRVIVGVETAAVGMSEGQSRTFRIQAEDAFGLAKASLMVNISLIEFPEDVQVGHKVGIRGLHAIVTKIGTSMAEVDCNHPLAGEDLTIKLEVLEIVKASSLEEATFSGGPFWPLELAFMRLPGVVSTQVGYSQGTVEKPDYASVSSGKTGHVECVQVTFDPARVSFVGLLATFFANVDVCQTDRQGRYVGKQYRSGIYYHSASQRTDTAQAMQQVQAQLLEEEKKVKDVPPEEKGDFKIVTDLRAAAEFWSAEPRALGPAKDLFGVNFEAPSRLMEKGGFKDIPPEEKGDFKIVTDLRAAAEFSSAEPRHQQYLEKLGMPSWKGCQSPIHTSLFLDPEEDQDEAPSDNGSVVEDSAGKSWGGGPPREPGMWEGWVEGAPGWADEEDSTYT